MQEASPIHRDRVHTVKVAASKVSRVKQFLASAIVFCEKRVRFASYVGLECILCRALICRRSRDIDVSRRVSRDARDSVVNSSSFPKNPLAVKTGSITR